MVLEQGLPQLQQAGRESSAGSTSTLQIMITRKATHQEIRVIAFQLYCRPIMRRMDKGASYLLWMALAHDRSAGTCGGCVNADAREAGAEMLQEEQEGQRTKMHVAALDGG